MDAKPILKHMGKFSWLLIFIPISMYYGFFTHETVPTVITTILAIIPLAAAIGYATEELVLHLNPAWGGLINATFGNIIELIVAGLALQRGMIELVQASIVGSILGNILLLMGLSIFAGGLRHKEQCFNAKTAGVSSTMLIIAIAGLALPTVYYYAYNPPFQKVQILSDAVALVLALTYIAGLLFSLKTHKHLFDSGEAIKEHEKTSLTKKDAIILLMITTGIAALLHRTRRKIDRVEPDIHRSDSRGYYSQRRGEVFSHNLRRKEQARRVA
jgi:Ca2+:H+ antiporter